jgi:DNA / pantothenate metabolism flavoprotein
LRKRDGLVSAKPNVAMISQKKIHILLLPSQGLSRVFSVIEALRTASYSVSLFVPDESALLISRDVLREALGKDGEVYQAAPKLPEETLQLIMPVNGDRTDFKDEWLGKSPPSKWVALSLDYNEHPEQLPFQLLKHVSCENWDGDSFLLELSRCSSPHILHNRRILVTGGSTPVRVDAIRVLTTQFTGGVACAIAQSLYSAGAEVTVILGLHTTVFPKILTVHHADTFDTYRNLVHATLTTTRYDAAIFSAAVADYKPETILPGKIPSGRETLDLTLRRTPKVIREVREKFPDLFMITFKFETEASRDELHQLAHTYLQNNYQAVVANSGELMREAGCHTAEIVCKNGKIAHASGKIDIASKLTAILADNLGVQTDS